MDLTSNEREGTLAEKQIPSIHLPLVTQWDHIQILARDIGILQRTRDDGQKLPVLLWLSCSALTRTVRPLSQLDCRSARTRSRRMPKRTFRRSSSYSKVVSSEWQS